jgi:hydroxypyruvate isomerase
MITPKPFTIRRRRFLAALAVGGVLAAVSRLPAQNAPAIIPRKGRLKQAVCGGVFSGLKLELDGMCRETARLGLYGIDLIAPSATLKQYGLLPTMVPGGSGIQYGVNDQRNHADIEIKMRAAIQTAAEAGAPNVIVLSGGRKGITDEEGLAASVEFFKRVKGFAEEKKVTLCLELLNSKVNHPGYMCDHTAWGVKLCQQVDSSRVKLLYDIYHMQIMEGDVIRTIRDNIQYIGHFHTAGNPGRHEFDDTQELNYAAICQAIADTGYQGYLSHEYTPTRNPLETLEKMVRICEV